jgi:hypothetical protein
MEASSQEAAMSVCQELQVVDGLTMAEESWVRAHGPGPASREDVARLVGPLLAEGLERVAVSGSDVFVERVATMLVVLGVPARCIEGRVTVGAA